MTIVRRDNVAEMLNKVPEITIYFWIIKVLCTTVGETAADFLNAHLGLGLTITTCITGGLLIVTLLFQLRAGRYVPGIYWLAVVLLSIVGTQITDNLVDNFGVTLVTTTTIFTAALVVIFAAWYASEKTLSVHTIDTTRREAFYWLAILFTFALGTAAGDLIAERLNAGYGNSALLFAALIAVVTAAYYIARAVLGTKHPWQSSIAVLAFWLAYILTRPLGASLGDLFSQAPKDGGLGLGAVAINSTFLAIIVSLVTFLAVTRIDATERVRLSDN